MQHLFSSFDHRSARHKAAISHILRHCQDNGKEGNCSSLVDYIIRVIHRNLVSVYPHLSAVAIHDSFYVDHVYATLCAMLWTFLSSCHSFHNYTLERVIATRDRRESWIVMERNANGLP